MTIRKSRYLNMKPAPARAGHAPAAPVRGALVPVDARPIRAAAMRKYRQSKDKFAEVQRVLARFHDHDKPQFERWLQSAFGALVKELRSVQAELNRLRELIFEVETRTWFNNQSCAAAYRDVLERQARKRSGQEVPPDPDDLEEKMRAHLEAEAADDRADAAEEAEPVSGGRKGRRLSAEKETRLKAAYRSLARRLHPDRHANVTPQMRERWHEAQQAYLAGDVELLESMETLCDDEDAEVGAETPVSAILERAARLVVSITQLGGKVQHGRKDPAWAFSELADFSDIKRVMTKSLPLQVKGAREEIAELKEKVSQWQADAERFYPGFKEAHEEHHKEQRREEAGREAKEARSAGGGSRSKGRNPGAGAGRSRPEKPKPGAARPAARRPKQAA